MSDKPAFLSNNGSASSAKPVNPGESLGGPKPSLEDHLGSMRNAQQPKGDDINKESVPEGGDMPWKAAAGGKEAAPKRALPFSVHREEGHTPSGGMEGED